MDHLTSKYSHWLDIPIGLEQDLSTFQASLQDHQKEASQGHHPQAQACFCQTKDWHWPEEEVTNKEAIGPVEEDEGKTHRALEKEKEKEGEEEGCEYQEEEKTGHEDEAVFNMWRFSFQEDLWRKIWSQDWAHGQANHAEGW